MMRVFIIEKAVTSVSRLLRITLYLKTHRERYKAGSWNMGEVIPGMQMQSGITLSNTRGTIYKYNVCVCV